MTSLEFHLRSARMRLKQCNDQKAALERQLKLAIAKIKSLEEQLAAMNSEPIKAEEPKVEEPSEEAKPTRGRRKKIEVVE